MSTKFSQFNDGGILRSTDTVVGLRSGANIRMALTDGIKDTNGNYLLGWATVGVTATNYVRFTNAATGNAPLIDVTGALPNIPLAITTYGTGDITITPGSSGEVKLPVTTSIQVPAGTTAQRPATGAAGKFRYNTDTDFLEYWDVGTNDWEIIIAGSAFDDATYVTNTDETADLPNSQPLSALATGIMRVTTSTGIIDSLTIPLDEIYGGTGQSTYTLGDTLYSSAANTLAKLAGNITTAKQYLSQTGTGAVSAAPVWSTISGGDITGAALTKVDDANVTLTLGGTPATALLKATSITVGWTGVSSLARGGTNKALVADNGGIVYSDADSLEILASTATAGKVLQSGASAAPSWSTPTYPSTSGTAGKIIRSDGTNNLYSTSTFADTYAASSLLYSNGANTVTGLTTANSAVLVTTSAGVPVWSSTMTNGQVIIGSTGATPVAASLIAGANVTITPGAGTITIASSGGGGSGSAVSESINQTAHGFVAGKWLYLNSTTYTLAIATSAAAAEIVGVVASVTDADNFVLQTAGFTGAIFSGLTSGNVEFLSASSAGDMTTTPPSSVGQIVKPLLVAQSATGGVIIPYRGNEVTGITGAAAATQAEMEAASSTAVYVSPGRAQYHPSAAKAWVKYTGISTTAIIVSYNITSLTDNGTGNTTVTFTVPFSSADYATVSSCSPNAANPSGSGWSATPETPTASAPLAGSIVIITGVSNLTPIDAPYVSVSFLGDQ